MYRKQNTVTNGTKWIFTLNTSNFFQDGGNGLSCSSTNGDNRKIFRNNPLHRFPLIAKTIQDGPTSI